MKRFSFVICILILASIAVLGCSQKKEQETTQTTSASTNNTATVSAADNSTEVKEPDTKDTSAPVAEEAKGYIFEHNGTKVGMGLKAEPIVDDLGDHKIFESPSCAFEGIDRIYYYNGFELFTYPVNDVDHVLSVNLTDDSVQTTEGIYLGMTIEDVNSIYGEADVQEDNLHKYIKDGTSLSFLIDDGFVVSITYNFIVD